MSMNNAPPARSSPGSVWSGSEAIVWGGCAGASGLGSGGRYRP
jgi:hypothetical protein